MPRMFCSPPLRACRGSSCYFLHFRSPQRRRALQHHVCTRFTWSDRSINPDQQLIIGDVEGRPADPNMQHNASPILYSSSMSNASDERVYIATISRSWIGFWPPSLWPRTRINRFHPSDGGRFVQWPPSQLCEKGSLSRVLACAHRFCCLILFGPAPQLASCRVFALALFRLRSQHLTKREKPAWSPFANQRRTHSLTLRLILPF